MKEDTSDETYIHRLFEIAVWIVLLLLIIIRVVYYKTTENQWIWIVNYLGMVIAAVNIFIKKCMKLKRAKNKKYKPFIGLTVMVLILLILLAPLVYFFQTSDYSQTANDVITLLALFFSLSGDIWDVLLNVIVGWLKR